MRPFSLMCLFAAACGAVRPATIPDEQVIERSHRLLLAYDNANVAELDRELAASFLHVDGGRTTKRADDLKLDPADAASQITRRSWSKEQVSASPGVRIFRGLADEEPQGNEVHGNFKFSGWYTLVWVRENDAWRVGLLTWQRAGRESEDHWNDVYRNRLGFTTEPNKLLVAAAAGVAPGRALDVATGQGRNGLYLASLGWKVTGVDFAMEGLRQASEAAAQRKLDFETVYADLDKYDFGVDKWDLVAMIYVPDHPEWVEKIKRSIRHGGLFVLEFFAHVPGSSGATDLAALEKTFAGWEITKHEVVEDTPDWAENRAKLVRFVARRP